MPHPSACSSCRSGEALGFSFQVAFQPIVDLEAGRVWAYEALVRGPAGEGAAHVLAQVDDTNRYRFDQAARVQAIEAAARLFGDGDARVSINFMPNAVYEPAACIRASLDAARRAGFPRDRIMFEFTEDERLADVGHLARILKEYRRQGFVTAIDDFGAGYAGLNLLADLQTDVLKIDMQLTRGIEASHARQVIVRSVVAMAQALDITLVAEGIETRAEAEALRALGITLFQGYLFAKPVIGPLPPLRLDGWSADRASPARQPEGLMA